MRDIGFSEDAVFGSGAYARNMEILEDPKLKDNQMYKNIVQRLSGYYMNTQKIRANGGLTKQQQDVVTKSGFSHAYRDKLHKCLRDLLIHIVNEKSMEVKLKQLA